MCYLNNDSQKYDCSITTKLETYLNIPRKQFVYLFTDRQNKTKIIFILNKSGDNKKTLLKNIAKLNLLNLFQTIVHILP